MSNFFNKNNKVDRSFVNNFKALPFNPPNLDYHKMEICTAASNGDYALVQVILILKYPTNNLFSLGIYTK